MSFRAWDQYLSTFYKRDCIFTAKYGSIVVWYSIRTRKLNINMNSNPVYTPGDSPLEEQWITDLLAKSAPMTTTNSFTDALNFEMSNFEQYPINTEFSSLLEDEGSIFSGSSRSSSTVSSTPPIKEEDDEDELSTRKTHILDGVSAKLQMMQRRNDLTPKALESIFDTKDVLKDTMDGQAGLASNTLTTSMSHPEPVVSQPKKKKRCSRRRLTDTQKEAHNKVEKKYRVNINSKINSLQTIIPWFSNDANMCMDLKINKSVILEKAFDYIVYLKSENAALKSRLGKSA